MSSWNFSWKSRNLLRESTFSLLEIEEVMLRDPFVSLVDLLFSSNSIITTSIDLFCVVDLTGTNHCVGALLRSGVWSLLEGLGR